MELKDLLVIGLGFVGIIFTYWFFLGKKPSFAEATGGQGIDVVVEGGYSPEVISIPRGKTTKINFIRKDSNSCLEEVVLPDFKIKKYLPLNQKVTIEITPQKSGEFGYSCGMNMYHGKIIVR
ncbi:MAG: hypothetical protein G01um10145_401 [Microgenomates group bacterium Gr01-1014_5]|nr:MAG: hypothetical protein G01um10145_401 [Microgenomates group bacterium Gr01-1014_5]